MTMAEDKVLEILKQSILLEKQGKAFYENIAAQTKSAAARNIFSLMAEEEKKHVAFLSSEYSHYTKSKSFSGSAIPDGMSAIADIVLSKDVKSQISAASFEAAAVSAAIEMENKAIKLYSERYEESEDTNEKNLYKKLADWEREHAVFLIKISNEIIEEIWGENQFWES
jgi:rubrerythrin